MSTPHADEPAFSPEGAQDILGLDFSESDKQRMQELSAKARAGALTAEEDIEAGRYEMLGHLLGILQSKARQSLKSHRGEGESGSPEGAFPPS